MQWNWDAGHASSFITSFIQRFFQYSAAALKLETIFSGALSPWMSYFVSLILLVCDVFDHPEAVSELAEPTSQSVNCWLN